VADEAYLRDSILLPRKEIAAGYAPIMPSFTGQIGESDLFDLIAYIRSLADTGKRPR
jgi:cytochrome c oxidase subunit 2